MDKAIEKSAGGDDGGARQKLAAVAQLEAKDTSTLTDGSSEFLGVNKNLVAIMRQIFDHEVDYLSLANMEAWLAFEYLAHLHTIELLVALSTGTPHGRAARCIQQTELDADSIGNFAHDAAERVDFAHQVSFGHAADGWIAAHLCNQVEVHGDDRGLESHARRRHCRFAASVSCAHNHYIVLFGESHPILFYGCCVVRDGQRLP